MEATRQPLSQDIVPDTTRAVGAVAAVEAPVILETRISSCRDWALGLSQAWKPERDTSNALHSHAAGQMLRCFAMIDEDRRRYQE
jgi:hypothetical protein